VQLGGYGEGYLTSLRGATKLLEAFRTSGVRGCPDQQLNDPAWHALAGVRAVRSARRTPWVLLVTSNEGDISRSPCISIADQRLLRRHTMRHTAVLTAVGPRPTTTMAQTMRQRFLRVNHTAVAQKVALSANTTSGYGCRALDIEQKHVQQGSRRRRPARRSWPFPYRSAVSFLRAE